MMKPITGSLFPEETAYLFTKLAPCLRDRGGVTVSTIARINEAFCFKSKRNVDSGK